MKQNFILCESCLSSKLSLYGDGWTINPRELIPPAFTMMELELNGWLWGWNTEWEFWPWWCSTHALCGDGGDSSMNCWDWADSYRGVYICALMCASVCTHRIRERYPSIPLHLDHFWQNLSVSLCFLAKLAPSKPQLATFPSLTPSMQGYQVYTGHAQILCECWNLNSSLLFAQQTFLTTKPSLQLQIWLMLNKK